ncbi:MAG: MFS transporter [Myxococcales bacterium]|nr:MFS transporter [Myxococcales bacterium]
MNQPLSFSRRWAIAAVATLTMAVSYVDRQALAAIAPIVCAALAIREREYGVLQSAFSLAYLVGTPVSGAVLDRVGARRGLVIAVLVWSVIAGLHSIALTIASLFVLRLLLGLAESPSFPGAAQTVHKVLLPSERATGFGVLFVGSSIGAAIAPPLATGLAGAFGWRASFVGVAAVGLLWVPCWIALTSGVAKRVLDGDRVAPEIKSGDHYRDRPKPDESADPFAGRALAAHPAVWRAVCAVLFTSPLMALCFLWSSKILVVRAHIAPLQVGKYLWVPPVLFDLASIAFGWLSSRRHRHATVDGSPKALFAVAAVMAVFGGALIGRADTPWTFVAAVSLAISGGGAMFALLTEDMLSRVSPSKVSTASGITAASQSIAYVIANPLIGVARERYSDAAVTTTLGLLVIPGALVWLATKAPKRAPQ